MVPDDYDVGYKKPPKHTQFKKGESGNPKGRRKKEPSEPSDMASLVRQLGQETHVLGGREVTLDEIILRRLYHDAASGNARARAQYIELRRLLGSLEKEKPRQMGGVLVIPAAPETDEEWERRAVAHQAKYRERPDGYEEPDEASEPGHGG